MLLALNESVNAVKFTKISGIDGRDKGVLSSMKRLKLKEREEQRDKNRGLGHTRIRSSLKESLLIVN